LTNAFTRLGHRGERWLVFLAGHGERSPDRQANFDLSIWATQLNKRGFKTRTLNLSEMPRVPTTPRYSSSPAAHAAARGEVRAIEDYLAHGGDLLWLVEPGNAGQGLERSPSRSASNCNRAY